MIKKILPIVLISIFGVAHADPSFESRDEGGYSGIINNSLLFIKFCNEDGKDCIESRAEAWGQVCDKTTADAMGENKAVYDYIESDKIYYSWRCEMLGESTIPANEQHGLSAFGEQINNSKSNHNLWYYYSKIILAISGEKQ